LVRASLLCASLIVASPVSSLLNFSATPVGAALSLLLLRRRLPVLILPTVPIVPAALRLCRRRNK
jgi:hypothetical protein